MPNDQSSCEQISEEVAIYRQEGASLQKSEVSLAVAQERQALRKLMAASDREWQRISYEIHDGLIQQLAGAIMQLQSFESLRVEQPSQAGLAYQRAVALLSSGLAEARQLMTGLHPPLLDDAGPIAAIENLALEWSGQSTPEIECHSNVGFGRLDPVLENAIFRIVHESLTNALRHSWSERVQVVLRDDEDSVEIEIRDWGIGFVLQQIPSGCFGLEGIQERARLLGGTAEIDSQPGRGTSVRVRLPLIAGN
jgi:signal transduction histidine kinase